MYRSKYIFSICLSSCPHTNYYGPSPAVPLRHRSDPTDLSWSHCDFRGVSPAGLSLAITYLSLALYSVTWL